MQQCMVIYSKELILPTDPTAEISFYPWDISGYKPSCKVYATYNEQYLLLRFFSDETALYVKTMKDDGAVYMDNCMEFFVRPFADDPHYFNFECNPLAKMIIGYQTKRGDGLHITEQFKSSLAVQTGILDQSGWWVEYKIPAKLFEKVLKRNFVFEKGMTLLGNFYCCAEHTEIEHFGCWSNIDLPSPEFHCPAFFGKILLR